MVKMGTVWDRTMAFLGERTAALMPIVLLLILLPVCVRNVLAPLMETGGGGTRAGIGLLVLALSVVMAWAQLSIVALVIEPGASASSAVRVGGRRLLPAIGVGILVGVIFLVAALPLVIAFAGSGMHWVGTGPGRWVPEAPLPSGLKLFVLLYGLAYIVFLFWAGARLVLVNSVVVAERRGVGAIRRAFLLTKGFALKIIGIIILFLIVFAVCGMAVTTVLGSLFQLLFGGEGAITAATVLTAIASGVVTTAFTALAAAFLAELYLAVRASHATPAEAE
jgi:hypothetical protein